MLVFHMLGAIAEFERALIRERTAAGLAEARRKGRVGGRPRRMERKDVAAARALLADGTLTSKEVAARFNVSKATLYRHLALQLRSEWTRNFEPVLVDREAGLRPWMRAQLHGQVR